MEYLNDEMDDLFRKAGEHYHLKTTDSDWDGILGRLQPQVGGESPASQESGKKKSKKSRRFFWLLLLLPLGLFSLNYFSGSEGKNTMFSTVKAIVMPLINSEKGKVQRNIPSPQNIKNNNLQEKKAAKTVLNTRDTNSGSQHKREAVNTANNNISTKNKNIKESDNLLINKPNTKNLTQNGSNPLANSVARITAIQQANSRTANVNTKTVASDPGNKEEKSMQVTAAKETVGQPYSNQAEKSIQAVSVKDSVKLINKNQKNKKSAKPPSAKEKGIFISLVAGPDFSTIKFQSVKKAGYSIGLLAGYRFNKHISLETGVLWDKKQYYSDGKYFNISKISIPYSVNIKDLDGNCNMFEIPVSFRYDFSFSPKGRFFSTAGLSTYIMKKENYEYNAESYGSSWTRKASYNNSGTNFFSILQFSAGYEYNWGKIGRIRVEPYLKIPLTGVGIGSLPISSAGLHLGITHPFR